MHRNACSARAITVTQSDEPTHRKRQQKIRKEFFDLPLPMRVVRVHNARPATVNFTSAGRGKDGVKRGG
jgi:hypothetical protein